MSLTATNYRREVRRHLDGIKVGSDPATPVLLHRDALSIRQPALGNPQCDGQPLDCVNAGGALAALDELNGCIGHAGEDAEASLTQTKPLARPLQTEVKALPSEDEIRGDHAQRRITCDAWAAILMATRCARLPR